MKWSIASILTGAVSNVRGLESKQNKSPLGCPEAVHAPGCCISGVLSMPHRGQKDVKIIGGEVSVTSDRLQERGGDTNFSQKKWQRQRGLMVQLRWKMQGHLDVRISGFIGNGASFYDAEIANYQY